MKIRRIEIIERRTCTDPLRELWLRQQQPGPDLGSGNPPRVLQGIKKFNKWSGEVPNTLLAWGTIWSRASPDSNPGTPQSQSFCLVQWGQWKVEHGWNVSAKHRYYSKSFPSNTLIIGWQLSPFYICRNWSTEKLYNLLKVSQGVTIWS